MLPCDTSGVIASTKFIHSCYGMKTTIVTVNLKINVHHFKHKLSFLAAHNGSYLDLDVSWNSPLCAVINTYSAGRTVFVTDCQPMALSNMKDLHKLPCVL